MSSRDALVPICLFLQEQVEYSKRLYAKLMQVTGEGYFARYVLFYSLMDTADSIHKLACLGKHRDLLMLSRSAFETGLNFHYIDALGEKGETMAFEHAMQKSFRELYREVDAGAFSFTKWWSGISGAKPDPKLQEAIDKFTTAKGKEERQWTADNIDRRLEIVGEHASHEACAALAFLRLTVVRSSSELLHGTLAGVLLYYGYSPGVTDPRMSNDEAKSHINENTYLYCALVGELLSTVSESVTGPLGEAELGKEIRASRERMRTKFAETTSRGK